jgi:hypothetical protein
VRQLLPDGVATAQIMELAAPPRLVELSTRLQAAAQRNPDWFAAHVKAALPGEPLAYDVRLGLTEPEYRQFLALADSMVIRPVGPAELRVAAIPGGWRLDGGTALPDLSGIEIDTLAWEVRTSFGKTSTVKAVVGNANQKTTGQWNGVQWHRADSSIVTTGSGTGITFSLGRLRDSGRVLLYYDAKQAAGGVLTARATRILTFDTRP